ncbi:alpha/beta fold hydrolase [Nonomuraea sp. M3C6]|uniref:Alpha/beta fold hydrolase n=1 Tax=Nonomuraea marmarensis TaxID=3351344 RepID=A0ABW7AUL0_9ACTN
MTETIVTTALGQVAVTVRGAGAAVVLLHANPGDSRDFDAIVPVAAEHFTTYAVDWPGYGRSPALRDPAAVTAMAYADILPDILSGLGLARAAFVGNSVGGYAAARLAITHPASVTALVLANSGGFTRQNIVTRAVTRLKGTERVTGALIGRLPRLYLRERTPVVREMLARDTRRRGDPAAIALEAAIWRSFNSPAHDLRGQAAQITAPVLLIWGTRDPLLGNDGRQARRCIPRATWHPLQTGHAPFAEAPDDFLAAALPFLESAHNPAIQPP